MNHRVRVRRRAKADLRSAARWYELQRPGLGKEFVAEVDAALSRVAANPSQQEVLHRGTRRAMVHRFPYGVFYRVEEDAIVVFCVIHLHRDPAAWKARIP